MNTKAERWASFAGVVAVVLWIVGIFVVESAGITEEGASDAEILANYQDDANSILVGSWIFMVGCLAFLWFAVVLRQRLGEAEGGTRMFSNVAFLGAAATGAFALLTNGPDIAAAIAEDDLSPAAAAAMGTLGDAFFVAAELSAILLMIGAGAVALLSGLFPKWWAWFSFLVALILLIGPIGWAALIFGLPLWILGTTFFLVRQEGPAVAPREP